MIITSHFISSVTLFTAIFCAFKLGVKHPLIVHIKLRQNLSLLIVFDKTLIKVNLCLHYACVFQLNL